jgi:hypothetical protein
VVMTLTARHLPGRRSPRSGSPRALVTPNQLEQSVLDLETGSRGYLMAGRLAAADEESMKIWAAVGRDRLRTCHPWHQT